MTHSNAELPAGTRIGPYEVVQPLGRGAQARVYVGKDAKGRFFAIKVRRRGQDAMDRRFLREFESMRLLRLPGVVQVHEAGIEEEFLWFSMDIVYGRAFLRVLLDEPDLETRVKRCVQLGRELMFTLSKLHEAGFVHRDVKPSNVLVTDDGRVRVLDFGIGRYFATTDTLSQSGEILGTVPYMAPEQLAGLPFDARVDVFASGTMLWECINGKRPKPLTTIGWIPRICLEQLEPLAVRRREVSLGFSRLIQDMLQVDPADRPDAAECVARFDALTRDEPTAAWPRPMFVDPGEWWTALEAALGRDGPSHVWVLESEAGAGKRRITEQIHRTGLMSGIWPIHLHCRIETVGGPLEQFLRRLMDGLDEGTLERVIGDDAEMLRRMWPHLGLAMTEGSEPPSTGEIAASLTQVVRRCADQQPLLLVIHDLERIDTLTARVLVAISKEASETLGMVVLHETRWATPTSRRTVSALANLGAQRLEVPPLPKRAVAELITSLCPEDPPADMPEVDSPHAACEEGWRRLAAWRGEKWRPFPSTLWPFAVWNPLPKRVAEHLIPPTDLPGWTVETDGMLTLKGATANEMARWRLASLQQSARAIADAVEAENDPEHSHLLATLSLLSGDGPRAWHPAAEAAIRAEQRGQYAFARQLLLLLDTLPVTTPTGGHTRFEVSFVQGRVALRTDVATRTSLVEFCEHLASTEPERLLARILRAEYALREGDVRPALVASLRVASAPEADNNIQIRALLVAIQCRLMLGHIRDGLRELKRVEAIAKDPLSRVRALRWKAELAHASGNLEATRTLATNTLRHSERHGYTRGIAFASSRLGSVLRKLGARRQAEAYTRDARDASLLTGDVYLTAETGLALATLLAERGEAAGGRQILDDTIHRIRGLHLNHLMPSAMRAALLLASIQGLPAEATSAISTLNTIGSADAEVPATLVRWWRQRSEVSRALDVAGPDSDAFGTALWHLERSRTAIAASLPEVAHDENTAARQLSAEHGFGELQTYSDLLAGVLEPGDDEAWAKVLKRASTTLSTETYLGAIEMDARRLTILGQEAEARKRWQLLGARCEELGYRPGMEESFFWMGDSG